MVFSNVLFRKIQHFGNLSLARTDTWISRINLVVGSSLRKDRNPAFLTCKKQITWITLRKCLEIASRENTTFFIISNPSKHLRLITLAPSLQLPTSNFHNLFYFSSISTVPFWGEQCFPELPQRNTGGSQGVLGRIKDAEKEHTILRTCCNTATQCPPAQRGLVYLYGRGSKRPLLRSQIAGKGEDRR